MAYSPLETTKIQAFDYDGSGNLIYQGQATPGSSKSAAVWKISKLIYNGSNQLIDVLLADGDILENNIWNNRATTQEYS